MPMYRVCNETSALLPAGLDPEEESAQDFFAGAIWSDFGHRYL